VRSDEANGIFFIEIQPAKFRVADAHRVAQHGLEHGLQISGRRADDLENLGSRCLLLERFG
jgi:hypothetical protein